MKKKFYYIVCLIFIISGIFYLVNEYITVINSTASISAYYTHPISDLAVPYTVNSFSSFYLLLKTTFLVAGPIFLLCYNYLFQNRIEKGNKLCFFLSLLVCIGVVMVGAFYTKGKYNFFHILGTVVCFASANTIILLTGLYYSNKDAKFYKTFCIMLSCVGAICGILLITPIPQIIMPIIERFTIYPLVIFEIVSGFYLLQQNYKDNIKYWIEIR